MTNQTETTEIRIPLPKTALREMATIYVDLNWGHGKIRVPLGPSTRTHYNNDYSDMWEEVDRIVKKIAYLPEFESLTPLAIADETSFQARRLTT